MACLTAGLGLGGCFVPKHIQPGKPFVFKNKVELTADVNIGDKKNLLYNLNQQLDDSMTLQVTDFFFVRHTLQHPPAFDTASANQTLVNMKYYLNSEGFFSPTATYTYKIDTVRRQLRVTTTFHVTAGLRTLLDSIQYSFKDPLLQHLADSSRPFSLLARHAPFSQDKITAELNRLIAMYKNYGFYNMTQDAFLVQIDTINPILINPTLDPLERIYEFAEGQRRLKNPTTDLYFYLNPQPSQDSNQLKRYFVRDIFIYPDYETTRDNRKVPLRGIVRDSITLRFHELKFKPNFLIRNSFLRPGQLYRQSDYDKTLNRFNYLSVWQVPIIQAREVTASGAPATGPRVDTVRPTPLDSLRAPPPPDSLRTPLTPDSLRLRDSLGYLDFFYLLTPAKKYSFNTGYEINYSNDNDNVTSLAGGNIFGTDVNFGITNHNFAKEAIDMTNTVNAGVEVNPHLNWQLASVDLGYTNTFNIPQFITPFTAINRLQVPEEHTLITTNATYAERIGYFDLNTLNFKYGFQWKPRPDLTVSYNPVDVEYSYIYNQTSAFQGLKQTVPFLNYAFTTALIMAQNVGFIYNPKNYRHPNRSSTLDGNLEFSGLLSGIVKEASGNQVFEKLYQYVKPELEYKHEIKYSNNNSWDFRLFGGLGIPLGSDTVRNKTLPFFKQFVAGGPNSMRAWSFRSLGPGATHLAPYSSTQFFTNFGDIQLEGNIEYRYNILEIVPNSLYLKGAVFTDIGNIWNFRKLTPVGGEAFDSAHLDISHFYQELAVGGGAGLRLDFNYFVLRFDFGLRFKRPDNPVNGGWQIPGVTLQHLIGNGMDDKVWRYNNYNFAFGIGYSF